MRVGYILVGIKFQREMDMKGELHGFINKAIDSIESNLFEKSDELKCVHCRN